MRPMRTQPLRLSAKVAWTFAWLLLACNFAIGAPAPDELASLGQALFFDPNLSATRNQSCASCHEPGRAFTDSRDNGVSGAVSLGDDGRSLGDRNTPGTTYAFLIPDFHTDDKDEYVGGYFLDGRAATMVDQAAEPFVNPIEMAMSDDQAVVDRVRENSSYERSFKKYFGETIFSDTEKAFVQLLNALWHSSTRRCLRRSIQSTTGICVASTSLLLRRSWGAFSSFRSSSIAVVVICST